MKGMGDIMKARLALFAAGTLGVLAIPGPALAAGSSSPVTLTLKERTVSIAFDDQGDPGPSVGDTLTYGTELTDAAGAPAGSKAGTCHSALVQGDGHLIALCTETLSLSGGAIVTTVGLVDQTALPTGAVQHLLAVGTAGPYAGWVGVEDYRATVYPTEFATTVRLRKV
jgi:hypothetical protein